MPKNPALIADTADLILTCACSALVTAGLMDEVCCDPDGEHMRAFVAEGEVAWDVCCNPCGQLSVRLIRVFESQIPPAQIVGGNDPCGNRQLIAEWEVLRLRCAAPIPEGVEAKAPPADAITANGRLLLSDVWTIWSGLRCCFEEWRKNSEMDLAGWIVDGGLIGPEGGCVGARVTAQTVLGPSCDCRPSTPPPIP